MEIVQQIALSETTFIPPIVKDYMSKSENLQSFVSQWHEMDGIEKAQEKRVFDRVRREVLVKHLHEQYSKAQVQLDDAKKVHDNIRHLLELNTFTITTGHQLSMFGGTLFMSYKILSAIKLSLELKNTFPQNNYVPVLWLASEDHDFEEIKTTFLFNKKLSWEKDSLSKATGKINLSEIDELVSQLCELLGQKETAKTWVNAIKNAYLKEGNLAEASIRLYHDLFKDFGLVILDPNAKEFKQEIKSIIHADLINQETYAVQVESDKVLDQHYKLQIHARPSNFFYLDASDVRSIIKKEADGKYVAGDYTWNTTELSDEIENYPERFSPNVNLRPVFQETILPNLAYFGGPAEVAYWLQLKPIFDHYQVPFPLVGLRYMNVLVQKNIQDKVSKLPIELKDLLLAEPTLTQKYVQQVQGISFAEKFEDILNQIQEVVDHAKALDVTLGKEFLAFKLQNKDFFKSKTSALKKAAELHEEAQIEKLLKLRARLFPDGVLQERIETLMQFESSLDIEIKSALLNNIQLFSGKMDLTLV
ncbi:MAG: bacillithiol biosynthesis cysteine-adding enzyme BshC [Bacteroidia bacterium]|nr:bacillithiol biosynthesis cysteine-adding enzyme BshC [Bacteroidia bacterium]